MNRDYLVDLITKEFDLELLLKYRELQKIEQELQRSQEQRELLEKLILNGKSGKKSSSFSFCRIRL